MIPFSSSPPNRYICNVSYQNSIPLGASGAKKKKKNKEEEEERSGAKTIVLPPGAGGET
jgi:hypothetical protein